MRLLDELFARFKKTPPEEPEEKRWLPVIDRDFCTGCGACTQACDRRCLELVWDFATLVRPLDCDGDGKCVKACPENLIRMDWVGIGRA